MDTPSITTATGAAAADPTKTAPATILQSILRTIRDSEPGTAWQTVQSSYTEFAGKYTTLGGRPKIDSATFKINTIEDAANSTPPADPKFVYISLRTFCEIVNGIGLVDNKDNNLVKLNTDIAPLGGSSNIPLCRFRTYKYHTSIDPGVCFLITPGTKNWSYPESIYDPLFSAHEGSSNEILNIQMNVDYLYGVIDSLIQGPKEERTLNNLFTPIFKQLNDVLGGINDINFFYEESKFTYYIVDRSVQVEKSDVSLLNITGLKSTVTKFDFTTKLSPNLTTMLAISAQAGAADVGIEAEALLRWNEGLTDRIITTKSSKTSINTTPFFTPPVSPGVAWSIQAAAPPPPPETDPVKLKAAEQQTRRDTINETLGKCYNNSRIYNRENIDLAKTQYQYFSTTYLQSHNEESENSKSAGPAGIIPFEVNLEMDGISGIKVGQAFKINESIMPTKYNGVVGFIVTGIDHSITANRWSTSLRAQTIILQGKVKSNGDYGVGASQDKEGFSKNKRTGTTPTPLKGSALLKTVLAQAGYKPGTFEYEFALVIGTKEGWLPGANRGRGSRSYRNNNPGNLDYSTSLAVIDPKVGIEPNGRFAIFSTAELGAKALVERKIKRWSKGNMPITAGNQKLISSKSVYKKGTFPTIEQFMYTYAPPNENNTEGYIGSVLGSLQKTYPKLTKDSKPKDYFV
jgi:hypothetical protein